jgi:RND family efflux transporter MFP subunit
VKLKRNHYFVIIAILVVVLVAMLIWRNRHAAVESNTGQTTAKVVRRDFSSTVLATGAVKPQIGAEVRVGARISGKVERLRANIGDVVQKGQIIAELEKADLLATVERCSAEISVAEAKVADADARLKLAASEHDRVSTLLEAKLTSQEMMDNAVKEQSVMQAGLRLAERQLDAARATLKENQAKLGYATITAPISGVVASVSTQEGETVSAGLNAPTFVTIIDLSRLQVDAYVDEVDIGKVHPGQKAVFAVDAFPGKEFEGSVTAIYPEAVIQENVVNYDVVVSIEGDHEELLRPEMTSSVTIFLESRKNVLAIPVKAVRREQGKTMVYVVTGAEPQPKEIKVGWKDGTWIEVVAGLTEGQTVLLEAPTADKKEE